jgi:hypothetical protein
VVEHLPSHSSTAKRKGKGKGKEREGGREGRGREGTGREGIISYLHCQKIIKNSTVAMYRDSSL